MWSMPDAVDVHRVHELERVRIAEVEPREPLGDDDRVLPVGREVHVVRIVDRDRSGPDVRSRDRSASACCCDRS